MARISYNIDINKAFSKGGRLMSAALKKLACTLVCAAVISVMLISGSVCGTSDDVSLYCDENGRYYVLDSQNESFTALCYSSNGERSAPVSESIYAQELIFSGYDAYAVCTVGGAAAVFRPFVSGDNMIMADDVLPKRHCTALSGGRLYIADSRDDENIRVYDDISEGYESVSAGQTVDALFVSDGRLFAMLGDGVLSVESGTKTVCAVPVLPFVRNGEIYCDSSGGVFRFSEEKGFERLCATGHANTVYCQGNLYALDGNSLLRFGMDGKQTGVYKALPGNADTLLASGNSLAVYGGGELVPIDRGGFASTDDEVKISEPTGDGGEGSDQSSTDKKEGLNSSRYDIRGGYIFGVDQGTTVAALKKELDYSGELAFRDYRGRALTSGRIGTGAEVLHYPDGSLDGTYTIVVTGDLTGEGNINTSDLTAMVKQLSGEKRLEEAGIYAADINADSAVDIRDLYILHRDVYS